MQNVGIAEGKIHYVEKEAEWPSSGASDAGSVGTQLVKGVHPPFGGIIKHLDVRLLLLYHCWVVMDGCEELHLLSFACLVALKCHVVLIVVHGHGLSWFQLHLIQDLWEIRLILDGANKVHPFPLQ